MRGLRATSIALIGAAAGPFGRVSWPVSLPVLVAVVFMPVVVAVGYWSDRPGKSVVSGLSLRGTLDGSGAGPR